MYDQIIIINGFSKVYVMTGMRLGYMTAPNRLAKAATTIQSQLTSCAGGISQAAGVAALAKVSEDKLTRKIFKLGGRSVISSFRNIGLCQK